ncbi:MAG: hypothetical protein KAH86_00870 [Methanosarcinales archaeon]|nr:hypothetical protein [Methanosarcinales archaeon]
MTREHTGTVIASIKSGRKPSNATIYSCWLNTIRQFPDDRDEQIPTVQEYCTYIKDII